MGRLWTRRETVRALAATLASGPLFLQTGCAWERSYQRVNAAEWINTFDALHPGMAPWDADDPLVTALDRIRLVPRLLVDVSDFDSTATLFGRKFSTPILVGPSRSYTGTKNEIMVWRGAQAARTTAVLGTSASMPSPMNSGREPAPWFWVGAAEFQPANASARAQEMGAEAIVLPLHPDAPTSALRQLEALTAASRLPVVASGVAGSQSARQAIAAGAQGLLLTNLFPDTSGRTGMMVVAPISYLAEVVDAVGPEVPVFVSNRLVRGADILKALALGAAAVFVDKPVAWGLASAGAAGVRRVLELLQLELAYAMAMAGVPHLNALSRSLVRVTTRRTE